MCRQDKGMTDQLLFSLDSSSLLDRGRALSLGLLRVKYIKIIVHANWQAGMQINSIKFKKA